MRASFFLVISVGIAGCTTNAEMPASDEEQKFFGIELPGTCQANWWCATDDVCVPKLARTEPIQVVCDDGLLNCRRCDPAKDETCTEYFFEWECEPLAGRGFGNEEDYCDSSSDCDDGSSCRIDGSPGEQRGVGVCDVE